MSQTQTERERTRARKTERERGVGGSEQVREGKSQVSVTFSDAMVW